MDREALNDHPLGLYDVTVTITVDEQDREIAWRIDGAVKPPIDHIYGYRLEPIDAGTMVTSYHDVDDIETNGEEIASTPARWSRRTTTGRRSTRRGARPRSSP